MMMLTVTNKVDAQLALSDFEAWCELAVIALSMSRDVSIDEIIKDIFLNKNISLSMNVILKMILVV